MQKPVTIIFCGEDTNSAQKLADSLKNGRNSIKMAAASPHLNVAETNEHVLVLADVPAKSVEAILRVYPHAVLHNEIPNHIKRASRRKAA